MCCWEIYERRPPQDALHGVLRFACCALILGLHCDVAKMKEQGRSVLPCAARRSENKRLWGGRSVTLLTEVGPWKDGGGVSLILETLQPCWCYKWMRKLKVAASFQVLTIEQIAQPTLALLLKLVKIKTSSRSGSCHDQCNYYIEDCRLNLGCWSPRLFKDGLGNLIHVSQDLCLNLEEVSIIASCLLGGFSFMCWR